MTPLAATRTPADAVRRDELRPHRAQSQPQAGLKSLPAAQSLTPFVGRTLELLELTNLLAQPDNRVLTLLGPGGMGKSRLGLRLLEDQADKFADGVAFVALAAVTLVADIPAATASALGLELSAESSVEDFVLGYLQSKTMLIVFDNFEQVLGGAAFVQRLLAAPRRAANLSVPRGSCWVSPAKSSTTFRV